MSSYLETFHTALRAEIATAWPEVLPDNDGGGIWHGIELATIPWETMVNGVGLPVAVLDVSLSPTTAYGLTARVSEGLVVVHYVLHGDQRVESLSPRLEALRDQLYGGGGLLDNGQILELPQLSWSMDLTPNRYFLGTQKPFMAGAVLARCVVGEDA